MRYFDELSIAQEMENKKCFLNGYTKTDVLLYAKYLRYKKIKDNDLDYSTITMEDMHQLDAEIEKELILFCKDAYEYFNYNVKFSDIDYAIKKSATHKIRLPLSTSITKKEWEAICSVENDNYRRMMFVMLVDAKYNRYHNINIPSCNDKLSFDVNTKSVFRVRMTESEICKAGEVKFSNEEEAFFSLACLRKAGLFSISRDKYRSWCVDFVDIDNKDNLIKIKDYETIALYYDKLMGGNIGECSICGKLFKQSSRRPRKYCDNHKGYNKKEKLEIRIGACVDCGKEFKIDARNRKKIRCDNCQKTYIKEYDRLRKTHY